MTFRWWFQKVPDQLVDLQLSTSYENRDNWTIPTEFLNAPQITQTPEFYFWCRAAFTDEQFLNLKANKFSFDCVNVTEDGINLYIKKWISGKGVGNFKRALLWSNRNYDESAITRGLELRPWDNDFETEAAGFCSDFRRVCGRGTCYQISSAINSYESLTLSLYAARVSIYGTGKKMEYDGRTYTHYSIP